MTRWETPFYSFNNSRDTAVKNATTLYGTGNVGHLVVENGGVVSPGHSIGGIGVDGDVQFASGAVYEVETDPLSANADLLTVSGTADLGGATVRHLGLGTTAEYGPEGEWTILRTEGGYGNSIFNPIVDGQYLFLNQEIIYPNANEVRLLVSENDRTFAPFAHTPNQLSVARSLDTLYFGELYNALITLPAGADISNIFDQLSGEIHSSVRGMVQNYDRDFGRALTGRIADFIMPEKGCFLIWASIDGFDARAYAPTGLANARQTGVKATLGYEMFSAGGWVAGGAFRYGRSELKVDDRNSKADLDSYQVGLYLGRDYRLGEGSLRWSLGGLYGLHDVDSKRGIAASGLNQERRAKYKAHSAEAVTEFSYRNPLTRAFSIEPFLGAGWNSVWTRGFGEHGGFAGLQAGTEHQGNFSHTLGLRGRLMFGQKYFANAEAGWLHLYGRVTPQNRFQFQQGGDRFVIEGAPLARNAAQLKFELGAKLNERTDIKIGYNALLSGKYRSHGGNLSMQFCF